MPSSSCRSIGVRRRLCRAVVSVVQGFARSESICTSLDTGQDEPTLAPVATGSMLRVEHDRGTFRRIFPVIIGAIQSAGHVVLRVILQGKPLASIWNWPLRE